ncbi:hypothetical protein NG697_12405 [Pseudarthrobacter sp. MDT3-26]|uniref:hypothetical protein n=1 Tax=Pseudarthrobacter raffinosi TaxID=2953651 RepID=UPI00208F48E8|nr:hypothetical protein [Pseudarthrobacter sp. MDT3-26]MCO4263713.1 hypothetical protein [Pseudarthrobacter sp. MDT3-26]
MEAVPVSIFANLDPQEILDRLDEIKAAAKLRFRKAPSTHCSRSSNGGSPKLARPSKRSPRGD